MVSNNGLRLYSTRSTYALQSLVLAANCNRFLISRSYTLILKVLILRCSLARVPTLELSSGETTNTTTVNVLPVPPKPCLWAITSCKMQWRHCSSRYHSWWTSFWVYMTNRWLWSITKDTVLLRVKLGLWWTNWPACVEQIPVGGVGKL